MYLVVACSFIAVFLMICAFWLAFSQAGGSQRAMMKRRLQQISVERKPGGVPESLRVELVKKRAPLEAFLVRLSFLRALDRLLVLAGRPDSLMSFIRATLLAAPVGYAAGYILSRKPLVALVVALAAMAIPFALLQHQKYMRNKKFTEQLPDALTMISRSLRAGQLLAGAIELASQEVDEPAKGLFRTAVEQHKLGLRLSDTLANTLVKIESVDLRYFVTAVAINSEVGGNLAEILDKLAETIRERLKLRRQVQALTAQGRLSGYVMIALPVVCFFALQAMMPGYENVLIRERSGQAILGAALAAQIAGFIVINRIVNIRI